MGTIIWILLIVGVAYGIYSYNEKCQKDKKVESLVDVAERKNKDGEITEEELNKVKEVFENKS